MIKIGVGAGSSVYSTMWFALLGTYLVIAVATALAQVVVLAWAISGHYSATDHQPMTAIALQWWVLLGVWLVIWYAVWVLK
jgi:heme/copper-type cytochrome/quinol oxidase subunit 3